MQKQVVGLLLLCLIAGSSAVSLQSLRRTSVKAARANLNRRTQSSASMWLDANEATVGSFMASFSTLTAEQQKEIKHVLGVRGNRFEAAYGAAIQENDATKWILRETLHRLICAAELLRPNVIADIAAGSTVKDSAASKLHAALKDADAAKTDKVLIGALFQLAFSSHDTVTILDKEAVSVFAKHDAGRSGPFLYGTTLDANYDLLMTVLAKGEGNVRELLHLVSRATGLGEMNIEKDVEGKKNGRQTFETAAKLFPGSFRHLLVIAERLQKGDQTAKALYGKLESQCKFNSAHFNLELANAETSDKKNVISPVYTDSFVSLARKEKDFRVQRDPKLKLQALLTPKILADLGTPLSKREIEYLKMTNSPEKTLIPWGNGCLVWDMTKNKDFTPKMLDDGLAVDAGPSGTTDEMLQLGDYFSTTQTLYGVCAFRDAAAAVMNIMQSHSLAEVFQGAMAFSASTGAHDRPADIDFSWSAPYRTIALCDAAPEMDGISHGYTASPHQAKSPKSPARFQTAIANLAVLKDPASTLAKAIQASDFAATEVPTEAPLGTAIPPNPHPFSVADEALPVAFAKAPETFKTHVCENKSLNPFPCGEEEKRVMCA